MGTLQSEVQVILVYCQLALLVASCWPVPETVPLFCLSLSAQLSCETCCSCRMYVHLLLCQGYILGSAHSKLPRLVQSGVLR